MKRYRVVLGVVFLVPLVLFLSRFRVGVYQTNGELCGLYLTVGGLSPPPRFVVSLHGRGASHLRLAYRRDADAEFHRPPPFDREVWLRIPRRTR